MHYVRQNTLRKSQLLEFSRDCQITPRALRYWRSRCHMKNGFGLFFFFYKAAFIGFPDLTLYPYSVLGMLLNLPISPGSRIGITITKTQGRDFKHPHVLFWT